MRPADLWRHTAFRISMAVSVSVLTLLLLAGGIAYGLMHAQLSARQNSRIQEIFAALEPAMRQDDRQDLVETVTARMAASPDRTSVYVLTYAGVILAANVTDPKAAPGWSSVDAAQLGIASDYPYRLLTGAVGSYLLTVGQSDADLDDLREIIANSLIWSALALLAGTIAAGVTLARRMQARLSLAEGTMQRVAEGDLSARLPVSGFGDDVDRLSGQINAALARLADVVRAMHDVTEDIAHDLRTPLTRLRTRIEDMARKSDGGQPVAQDLQTALADCDRINQTFSALLRIAQIQTGDRRAGFGSLDLAALLRDVAAIYAPVAEDAAMTLTAPPAAATLMVGDPELLTQMLANLIENAIQHGPPGTNILCEVAAPATLRIADTGPGIAPDQRDAVFRRLYRLDASRTVPGAGLGLTMVKAIADLHGASITLTATDGDGADAADGDGDRGLTVTITFPTA